MPTRHHCPAADVAATSRVGKIAQARRSMGNDTAGDFAHPTEPHYFINAVTLSTIGFGVA